MVNQTMSLGGPATYAVAKVMVVSEGDLSPQPLALMLKASSTVTVVTDDNDTIAFSTALAAGTIIPFRIKQITAIGTAGAVLGLY